MKERVKTKKGDFLNEEQKNIKSKMMNELLAVINSGTFLYSSKFDNQTYTDCILSILIMFNIEILVNFFLNSNVLDARGKVMESIFETIKEEVQNKIKEELFKKNNQIM